MKDEWTTSEYKKHLATMKPERRKPVQRESELQKSCVRWFRYTYPQYKDLLFSIPNGGHRNIITAVRMKAEGQVKGALDLFLAVMRMGYGGMAIEMKAPDGKASKEQAAMILKLRLHGYHVEICKSLDEFIDEINGYLL